MIEPITQVLITKILGGYHVVLMSSTKTIDSRMFKFLGEALDFIGMLKIEEPN